MAFYITLAVVVLIIALYLSWQWHTRQLDRPLSDEWRPPLIDSGPRELREDWSAEIKEQPK